jgi:Secretion system C-terminal sorting domain/SdrD B-like domain/FG-GAP-like repeat
MKQNSLFFSLSLLTVFSMQGQYSDPQLMARTEYQQPRAIDFDNNGNLDILFGDGRLWLDFETETPQEIQLPINKMDFSAIADYNGDGYLDYVHRDFLPDENDPETLVNTTMIGLSDGQGQITSTSTTIANYTSSTNAKVIDLDNDGDLDLNYRSYDYNYNQSFINDGAGNFVHFEGTTYDYILEMADIDGDGLKDILYKELESTPSVTYIHWRKALGSGESFEDQGLLITFNFENVQCIRALDKNGDGKDDLIMNGWVYLGVNQYGPIYRGGLINLYINSGNNSFTNSIISAGSNLFDGFELVDLDLNNNLDLLAYPSNYYPSAYFTILRNNGGNTFSSPQISNEPSYYSSAWLHTCLLNGASSYRLFSSGFNQYDLYELEYDPITGFGNRPYVVGNGQFVQIKMTDINGDNNQDILSTVSANQAYKSYGQRAYYSDSGHSLYPPKSITGEPKNYYNFALSLAYTVNDLNNDGRPDMIIAGGNGADETGCYLSNNTQGYTKVTNILQPLVSLDYEKYYSYYYSQPNPFQVVDLDENGLQDIIFNSSINYISVESKLNIGGNYISLYSYLDSTIFGKTYLTIDMDSDNDLDILTEKGIAFQTSTLTFQLVTGIFENPNSALYFNNEISHYTHVADIDQDGFDDLVVGPYIFHNSGDNTFEDPKILNISESYIVVKTELEDWDLDGDQDILLFYSNEIYWSENNGTRLYSNPVVLFDKLQCTSYTKGDWDSDGDDDLVLLAMEENTNPSYYNPFSQSSYYLLENKSISSLQINGSVFIDSNENGVKDNNETTIETGMVTLTPGATDAWIYNSGEYSIAPAAIGNYTVSYIPDTYLYNLTTPSSVSVNITELNPVVNEINFGVLPTGNSPLTSLDYFGSPELLVPIEEGAIYFVQTDDPLSPVDYFTQSGALFLNPGETTNSAIIQTGFEEILNQPQDYNNDGFTDFIVAKDTELLLVTNSDNTIFTSASLASLCGNYSLEDLDNDGDTDVIAENCDSETILLINNGSGQFTSSVHPEFTGFCSYMDIDLDGIKDVITYDGTSNSWNKGLGNLLFEVPLPLTGYSFGISEVPQFGDFDNDGDLDILENTIDSNNNYWLVISYLENDGDMNFSNSTPLNYPSAGFSNYTPALMADMNNDGTNDLIVCGYEEYTGSYLTLKLAIYFGNTDGTFEDAQFLDVDEFVQFTYYNSGTQILRAVDADLDGWLDLAATLNKSQFVLHNTSGILNSPALAHSSAIASNLMFRPTNLSTGPDLSLFIEEVYSGNIIPYFKTTNNNLTAPLNEYSFEIYNPYATYYAYPSIVEFNYNNDQYSDLAIQIYDTYGGLTIEVWQNNSGSAYELVTEVPTYSPSGNFETDDLNGDGYDEILYIDNGNYTSNLFWNNNGQYEYVTSFWSGQYSGSYDLDQNGLTDLQFDGGWTTFMQLSEGEFVQTEAQGLSTTSSSFTQYFNGETAKKNDTYKPDFNGDGFLDAITSTLSNSSIQISQSNWFEYTTENLEYSPMNVFTIFDIDGDLDEDIIYAYGYSIKAHINTGNGIFEEPLTLAEGFRINSMYHFDWDADGDEDLFYYADYDFGQDGLYWKETFISSDKKISGTVFYDENENGIFDTNEIPLSDIPVKLELVDWTSYTNNNGVYNFTLADEGDFTMTLPAIENWQLTTTQSIQVSVSNLDPQYADVNFGVIPDSIFTELEAFIQANVVICNNETSAWIFLDNTGTTSPECVVEFIIPVGMSYISSTPEASAVSATSVFWNVESLSIGGALLFQTLLQSPGVEFIGTNTTFEAIASSVETNPVVVNAFYTDENLLCSYDPNDKTELTGHTQMGYITGEEPMDYLVRFQNTGNFLATNVRIEDPLSSYLQRGTLEIVASSHPMEVSIDETGKAIFAFNNIMLPDSASNQSGSNGFVRFRILPVEGLAHGTVIENTGFIYFDYNPAIVTNTTQNTIYDCTTFHAEITSVSETACLQMVVTANIAEDWIQDIAWTINGDVQSTGSEVIVENILSDELLEVTISNALCESSASILIQAGGETQPEISTSSMTFCQGEEVTLTSNISTNNHWYLSGNLLSQDQNFTATSGGVYELIIEETDCETSPVSVTLTMYEVPAIGSLSVSGNMITADNITGVTYQWMLNDQPISGANQSSYTATESGNYSVQITTENDCSNTTASVFVQVIGVNELNADGFSVYPNPVSDVLTIRFADGGTAQAISIFNALGQIVYHNNNLVSEQKTIDVSGLASGTYGLEIQQGNQKIKTVVLVK